MKRLPIDYAFWAALPMAQTSKIERRLTVILDSSQSRRVLTRRALLVALVPSAAALVTSAAALVTLAVLRPVAKAQTPSAKARAAVAQTTATAQPPLLFVWPGGSSVRIFFKPSGGETLVAHPDLMMMTAKPTSKATTLFAGITDANRPGGPWWSASGTLLPTPVYNNNAYHAENHAASSKHTVSFAFRLPADAQDTTVQYKVPQSIQSSSDGFWPTKIEENAKRTEAQVFSQTHGVRVVTATFPSSFSKTSLRVGIASGAWTTLVHYLPPNHDNGSITDTAAGTMVFRPEATDFNLTLIPNKISGYAQKQDLRLIAIDALDHKILPTLIEDKGNGNEVQINAQFNVPIVQIKDIRIQTRPFQWIEYSNVALKPVP